MKQKPTLKRGDIVTIAEGTTYPKLITYTVITPGTRGVKGPVLFVGSPRFELLSKLKEGDSVKEYSKRRRRRGKKLTVIEIERKRWKLTISLHKYLSWLMKK